MNRYIWGIAWAVSVIVAMFLAAWGTATYVTRDMVSVTDRLKDDTPADEEEEQGDGDEQQRPLNELERVKMFWASRIPQGESKITWLI